jgi:hypothetical protein
MSSAQLTHIEHDILDVIDAVRGRTARLNDALDGAIAVHHRGELNVLLREHPAADSRRLQ